MSRLASWVALGSATGGVTRFLLGSYLQRTRGTEFPVATLFINITGSLLLGLLLRFMLDAPGIRPEVRALLTTGFCGGYTTFSTFSYEAVALIEEGDLRRALLYMLLSVAGSLVAAALGMAIARRAFQWVGQS
jgi:CrcB protein